MRRPVNAAERLALRAAYLPKDARCILEHTNGSACYAYERAGALYAIGFYGTAAKSSFHHRYRTEDARNLAIWNFRESVEQSVARRSKAQADRKAAVCTLKVGDIVNTSWGYDQTNVDFFVVTRVSKSSAWVRPIASEVETTGNMSGRTWPSMPIRTTGDETMHRASGTSLSIDGHHASLTTGDTYCSWYA